MPNQTNPSLQSPPAGANYSAPALDEPADPSPPPAPIVPVRTPAPPPFRPTKRPPIAPGYFTAFNLGAGYSVTDLAMPSSGRIALRGMDISLAGDGGRRIGAKLDLSYTRASNAFNSGHRTDVFSYLFGPVFLIWSGNSLSAHAHVLAGGARVAGPFPNANGGLSVGYVHYPAFSVGGSAEYRFSSAFGFRVTIDCLHAHFFDSPSVIRGQNDLRVVNSIVYYIGEPVRSRRR